VRSEVFEVFDVQGGQWEVIGKTTRGYPRIIRRPGPASKIGVRRDDAPRAGHVVVGVENVPADQPASQSLTSVRSPLTLLDPPSEFCEGDEGDKGNPAIEQTQHVRRELALQAKRRNVGVEDDRFHGHAMSARRAA